MKSSFRVKRARRHSSQDRTCWAHVPHVPRRSQIDSVRKITQSVNGTQLVMLIPRNLAATASDPVDRFHSQISGLEVKNFRRWIRH